ncbi:MAG: tRNA (adenosine(37)-N6)-threonylcarbamoyltransferase complex ATPase subunit type 1 TsaE [Planctomycetota bacterium]|nr:tRNA (adenosine(37)-N6)-threonylcarbamoyltransferase complex ATPase subunit type 1 TsaE [Planctomycetota bacterium]
MAAELSLVSHSVEATEALAEALGRLAVPDTVFALDGDLGTGKTAFTRGLARGLDVTEPVSSPTYTLMHSYPGRLELYHFDAWMEGREAAFLDGGGAEWLHAGGVAVVEWASRVLAWLPEQRLEVELLHRGTPTVDEDGNVAPDAGRTVVLRALGAGPERLLAGLQLPAGISMNPKESS